MSELAHRLCSLVPTWDIEWSDGSGAAQYGPFVALTTSGYRTYVEVYEPPADRLQEVKRQLRDWPAERWPTDEWGQVLSEPDDDGPEALAYVLHTLGLED